MGLTVVGRSRGREESRSRSRGFFRGRSFLVSRTLSLGSERLGLTGDTTGSVFTLFSPRALREVVDVVGVEGSRGLSRDINFVVDEPEVVLRSLGLVVVEIVVVGAS